ncbi:MAG TPA: FAD-dependent oxidoreductase [Bryobacteraceae bacterium]|nr:FAD-dependent oxidoreductase [Bryobacteraceae bacterium]
MSYDVVIAGAGIIGSSIAWRLAQGGLHVALFDAGRMGNEASSAGAGMLAPGGEIEGRSPWNDFALESLRLYPDFVAELHSDSGCAIDFQVLGAVELALYEDQWRALEARARVQASLGIPSIPMSPNDLKKQVALGLREAAGALFYPKDAHVDPRQVMYALRSACLKREVAILEGVRVKEMRPKRNSVEVLTDQGVIESAAAVLAAGAWSSEITVAGQSLPRAYPVRGHLIGFRLEPGSVGSIVRQGQTYLLQRTNGFTIAGSSAEHAGFNRSVDMVTAGQIHARAAELLPALGMLMPEERWVGFRPAVEGDTPAVGRAGSLPLWLAYGHYRNGILLAPATAERVAREIISSSGKSSSWLGGMR